MRTTQCLTRWSIAALLTLWAGALIACGSDGGATADICPTCPDPTPSVAPAPDPIDAPADSVPTDRPRTITFLGFSTDGSHFALSVKDEAMGSAYHVRETATGKTEKIYTYGAWNKDKQWRSAKRKFKLDGDATHSQKNAAGHVLLGADADAHVIVYVMSGERSVPYFRIPRLTGADGTPANVVVKDVAWSPNGRHAVVVHQQSATLDLPFESDYAHVFEVDSGRLPFD